MRTPTFAPLVVAAILAAALTAGRIAWANPSGEQVAAGSASFRRDGGNLTITTSDRAIINWQDFSIAGGELTKFLQPGSNSVTLNRVLGGLPSSIFGTLQANGKIFLINPNGILVGATGRVDTAGFLASTLDVSNQEFLGGGDMTFLGSSTASVVNQGAINAIGGDVFLIGRHVENHGAINASGTVGMAAGTEVLLKQAGTERVFVQPAAAGGKAGTGVANAGTIAAAAVEMKAHGNMYALAINNTGVVRATGAKSSGGRVYLTSSGGAIQQAGTVSALNADGAGGAIAVNAGAGGSVKVSGTLDAAGRAAGTKGGTVRVSAGAVELSDAALLDASGDAGGGEVTLGGDRGAVAAKADRLAVAPGARILADAVSSGDGGRVTLWSGGTTDFQGQISAKGAGATGAGGSAEVSGVAAVNFRGSADLRANGGSTGTLLLDPTDAEVNTVSTVAGATLFTPAAITAQTALSHVVVSTSATGAGSGGIFINAPVIFDSGNSLSFLAHGSVFANASVQNNGAGAVNVVAGWNGSTGFAGPAGLAGGSLGMAQILATPASYGNGGGGIFIGSSTSLGGVAVGSRFGATTVAAGDLALRGSDTTAGGFAQLGFRVDAATANVSGTITAVLKEDLTLQAGGAASADAQIGHGAALAGSLGTRAGTIELEVPGETSLVNGGAGARWLIGQQTGTAGGVAGADVSLTTSTLNFSAATTSTGANLSGPAGADFAAKTIGNLAGGDVSLRITSPVSGTAGGLTIGTDFVYSSANDLTFISDQDLRISAGVTIQNTGAGTLKFVADAATPRVGPGVFTNNGTISASGPILVFGASPGQVQLGTVIIPQRRFSTNFTDSPVTPGSTVFFEVPLPETPAVVLPVMVAVPPPPDGSPAPAAGGGNGGIYVNGQFINVAQSFDLGTTSDGGRAAPKKVTGSSASGNGAGSPPSATAPAAGSKPGVVGPFRMSSGQVP